MSERIIGNVRSASMAERFAAVDLVVVGSAMVDQITYCERIPDDGETLHARRYVQGFGGKGANQAVMAARLGAGVAFVGCVGDDAIGAATIENLARAGVDTSGVSVVAGTATGVAPIWVDDRGANRILIAAGANDALDAERVTAALSARGRTPHLVLAQLETPQVATAAAFAWASANGITTVLNPAPAAAVDRDVSDQTAWMIPNESEFESLFARAANPETVAGAATERGLKMVVTLGSRGAIVSDGDVTDTVAAPEADVIDTTGAGDAFVGAFCVGLAAGLDPAAAARLGCVAGALSVGAAGTQTSFPDRSAVLQRFDHVDTSGDPGTIRSNFATNKTTTRNEVTT